MYSKNNKCIFCNNILYIHRISGSVLDKICYQNIDHYFNDTDNYLAIYVGDYSISIEIDELEVIKDKELVYSENLSLKDDFESVSDVIHFMYKQVKVIADNLIFI